MKTTPNKKEAYQLFHNAALIFKEIELAGIRIDTKYCEREFVSLERRIKHQKEKIGEFEEAILWKQKYKEKFNLDSNPQLSDILFNEKGYQANKHTPKGKASVDAESLESLDIPIIKEIVKYRRLCKVRNTYLKGIMKETINGYLHPSYNLHTVRTYRTSSSNPNWQNIPIRVEEIKKIIRKAVIPRDGHRFGGIDYSGIEVRISACYHKDPAMIKYIEDPTSDLHKDMASELYLLKSDQVTKNARYCAKNKFVFPQFYGDWWGSCAKFLWEAIDKMTLTTVEGAPMKEHLKSKGISSLGEKENPKKGTFFFHVKEVENNFWYNRFKEYTRWKTEWLYRYEEKGYFDMLTGFRCSGIMGRNDVINYPVQGVAAHCLLWSLIRLYEWMKKEKMESKIVGQIHDEITIDAHSDELDSLLKRAKEIMTKEIREEWKWICVPLDVEAEFSPVNKSWYEKEVVKIS